VSSGILSHLGSGYALWVSLCFAAYARSARLRRRRPSKAPTPAPQRSGERERTSARSTERNARPGAAASAKADAAGSGMKLGTRRRGERTAKAWRRNLRSA
jgi:hypothetical protein